MLAQKYIPFRLSWVKSYEEEVLEYRKLILSNPADVNLLKLEYRQLTGKAFRRR